MILPTKRITEGRSLLGIGGRALLLLNRPKTVSRLWHDFGQQEISDDDPIITFDWFVLALDLLFALGALQLDKGRLVRSST